MSSPPVNVKYATHAQLSADRPNVVVLPWAATEAHNQHLPYGTDLIEAEEFAQLGAESAAGRGAKVAVLPSIPFGSNAQQQDQVACIHLSTTSTLSVMRDVALSLKRQGIDRLVILNGHGGNDFGSMVRDLILETGVFIAVVNFWELCPEQLHAIFPEPGDHAGMLETSLLLHLCPQWVHMESAGRGERKAFAVKALRQKGVWTPRPWSKIHPDLGSGDPRGASAEKGKRAVELIANAIADLLVELSAAKTLP